MTFTLYTRESDDKVSAWNYVGHWWDLDEETGLPKVFRAGDYWKVKHSTSVYFYVCYMRPRKFLSDKEIDSRIMSVMPGRSLSKDEVRWNAVDLMDSVKAELDRLEKVGTRPTKAKPTAEERKAAREREKEAGRKLREADRKTAKLLGKYPPKSLRGA